MSQKAAVGRSLGLRISEGGQLLCGSAAISSSIRVKGNLGQNQETSGDSAPTDPLIMVLLPLLAFSSSPGRQQEPGG